MTMQVRYICLYGKNGERRDVPLKLGKVNVITGASKKGKSSLIDIVEYCLGSGECNVATGRITQTVGWYGILLQFPDSQVFVARAAPREGQKSNSACYLEVAREVELPSYTGIQKNTNIDAVVSFLTGKLGIPENVTEIPENQTRSSIQIGFKHSRFYLFQGQDEIANKRTLFHRQAEPHIPQAIKDTLPYFMGAAEDDRLADLEKLRNLKRERTKLQKRIAEAESLKGDGLQRGFELLAEAAEVGLADSNVVISDEDLIAALEKIASWRPSDGDDAEDIGEAYIQLEADYRRTTDRKRIVRARMRAAESYESTMDSFQQEVKSQHRRLQSIGLYGNLQKTSACPVCEMEHQGQSSNEVVIRNAIAELRGKLEGVHRNRPRIAGYLNSLREEDSTLAREAKKLRSAIDSIQRQQPEVLDRASLDEKRSRVAGRISLYIESVDLGDADLPRLLSEVKTLFSQISALEEQLDPNVLKERLESQLSCISEDMTKWARDLGLEHSEHPIRLDASSLTVVAETPFGRTPLYRMGSGENWVGYHLVAYLALAKWFIEQDRPVGRFIFFDQPTQVYFPSDKSVTGKLDEIEKDEDRVAVKRMFEWIFKVVEQLSPDLQVIITDHADIDEDWFQEAVVDQKWRGDEALIPLHWYR